MERLSELGFPWRPPKSIESLNQIAELPLVNPSEFITLGTAQDRQLTRNPGFIMLFMIGLVCTQVHQGELCIFLDLCVKIEKNIISKFGEASSRLYRRRFCNKIAILQSCSRSTSFSNLCTASNQEIVS